MKIEQNETEQLQSKILDFLRFPLIIGVLFIHNANADVNIEGLSVGGTNNLFFFTIFSDLFSQVIGRLAVPLFFFISGFLFFYKAKVFDTNVYLTKIKSRLKTLVIPYIFWNFILLMLLFALINIPALRSFVNKKPEFNFYFIIKCFWSIYDGTPISYQFWFIRDLIVCVFLSPIIYFYIKWTKFYGIILLSILWYFNISSTIPGLEITSFYFFSFGALFSIYNKNPLDIFNKCSTLSLIIYPIIILIDLYTKQQSINIYIHNLGIVVGIIFCFNFTHILIKKYNLRISPFIQSSSFFLFAFHEPLLTIIKKIMFIKLNPQSDLFLTFLYFFIVFLVCVISLIVYKTLLILFPKFTKTIIGGR